MASVVLTERFVSDASGIWSDKALDRIRRCVLSLEAFPEMGSPDVPPSIRKEFGDGIRKVVVAPFDLVYEYEPKEDRVIIYALVPCAQAR